MQVTTEGKETPQEVKETTPRSTSLQQASQFFGPLLSLFLHWVGWLGGSVQGIGAIDMEGTSNFFLDASISKKTGNLHNYILIHVYHSLAFGIIFFYLIEKFKFHWIFDI